MSVGPKPTHSVHRLTPSPALLLVTRDLEELLIERIEKKQPMQEFLKDDHDRDRGTENCK